MCVLWLLFNTMAFVLYTSETILWMSSIVNSTSSTSMLWCVVVFKSSNLPKSCTSLPLSSFQADLFAVEILNGYIYVHIDLGSGGVRVRASRRRVDDSHWHDFLLRRSGRDGRVTVDGANAEFKTPGKIVSDCKSGSTALGRILLSLKYWRKCEWRFI